MTRRELGAGRRLRSVAARAAVVLLLATAPVGCGAASVAPRPLRVSVSRGYGPAEIATGVAAGGGRVLTVAHVLAGGGRVSVAGHPARVLRADHRLDLAVLAAPGVRGQALRFAARDGHVALRVLRDGRPRALPAVVRGRVVAHVRTAADGPPQTRPALELAARIAPGDSGAVAVDSGGRVVGVVFARSNDRADTAWAVDAAALPGVLGCCAATR